MASVKYHCILFIKWLLLQQRRKGHAFTLWQAYLYPHKLLIFFNEKCTSKNKIVQSVALFIINSHIELCNDCNVLLKTFFCFAKICAHFTWYHSTCYRSNNYSWKYPLHCLKMSSYSFVVSGKITFQMDRFNSGCTVQPGFSENTTTPHRQHQNKESCSFCFIHNNYLYMYTKRSSFHILWV